jgi:hypothetical protein
LAGGPQPTLADVLPVVALAALATLKPFERNSKQI